MTFYYKNVYIEDTSTIVGPYEKKGPRLLKMLLL